MSRTVKKAPYGCCFRTPKGHKKALIENVRSRAIPPDPWDDIKCSPDTETAYKMARRMIRRGEDPEETVRKISKYTYSTRQAQEIVAQVILMERFKIR